VVKAVKEVESSRKGFLADGRPKILFEGHVFWKQLVKRGIDPLSLYNAGTANVLYKSWTKQYYLGGTTEYSRLEKATALSDDPAVGEAACCATSWGAFQIMGYHYEPLGYPFINAFVIDIYKNEANHLRAFGRYLQANNLLKPLKDKNWVKFARDNNGPAYSQNKYDIKLKNAYVIYAG